MLPSVGLVRTSLSPSTSLRSARSPFFKLLPFLARKELSQLNLCGHPKSEAESKVLQKLCSASPRVSSGLRKWEGDEEERSRVCVCVCVSAVWKHTSRERNLIYHQKSTADVRSQIPPLSPIIDTHANVHSAPEFASSCTHIYTWLQYLNERRDDTSQWGMSFPSLIYVTSNSSFTTVLLSLLSSYLIFIQWEKYMTWSCVPVHELYTLT